MGCLRAHALCPPPLSLGGTAQKLGGGGACITAAAPGPQKRGLEHSGRPGLFLKDEKLRPGGRGRELTLTVSTMCQAYTMTLW